MPDLQQHYYRQHFDNDYELVDGVAMHDQNGDRFQIPPAVLKRQLGSGHFVELRLDSPRFSVHDDDAKMCSCPSCDGDMSNPILRHEHPLTLLPHPHQDVPGRGWGEDFWVQVDSCCVSGTGELFLGRIDNHLAEHRLHGMNYGDEIVFHRNHILAIHSINRTELVSLMNVADLKELAAWIANEKLK
ncbi:hypothetical protein [Planctomycetes bacterium K23_9]|uniref:Uncharacterized protein n=1 Tax=Stieleria marina TaxID=1930275 RepID=A0A517P041_9BACT|nr:hypothetical protein K239x_47520 [Planctomycetes bacterium K23_9]